MSNIYYICHGSEPDLQHTLPAAYPSVFYDIEQARQKVIETTDNSPRFILTFIVDDEFSDLEPEDAIAKHTEKYGPIAPAPQRIIDQVASFSDLLKYHKINQRAFSKLMDIPIGTVQSWCKRGEQRPRWLMDLIETKLSSLTAKQTTTFQDQTALIEIMPTAQEVEFLKALSERLENNPDPNIPPMTLWSGKQWQEAIDEINKHAADINENPYDVLAVVLAKLAGAEFEAKLDGTVTVNVNPRKTYHIEL